MRTPSGGTWIVGLLLLGPMTIMLVIYLTKVVASPPCIEQWADWCGEPEIPGTGLPRLSLMSKATEVIHALLLLGLMGWSSFHILRAAWTKQPLTPTIRYAVVAASIIWLLLFLI